MEVRHLRYFVAVADSAGVSAAARRLRITQPALSRQIRDLETQLGVRLFDRVGRRLRLTSGGQDLLRRCRSVLTDVTAIEEHARASEFRELLLRPEWSTSSAAELRPLLERLGGLMFEAHESYSACGLGSSGTDRLVELVREQGPDRGLFGAKITGGGSGGTVAVLGLASTGERVAEVAARYARETGRAPYVFSGSSPGAAAFGVRWLQPGASSWRVESGVGFTRERS